MYRVATRALAIWLLIAILLGGLGFFGYEYYTKAGDWVMETGNPNVYDSNGVALGSVYDRDGVLLVDLFDGRNYADDQAVRKSVLHWTGDRAGNIRSSVLNRYEEALAGFDLVGGIYDYGGLGGDLMLTLSSEVQVAALEALGTYKGTVAVYNYKTGQLLCAVTTPTFDPENVPDIAGDTSGTYEGVYWNRFLQSAYVPGSIFKIATTAAALEEIPDILSRTFTCTGILDFGVDKVTCERAHGMVDLKKAMEVSCNCAYAQIGLLLGSDTMERYISRFGVTERIVFDGVTTAAGNYEATDAADVELAWSAVGQYKNQINPCAFLTFLGAIANGGQGVTPHVVETVEVGSLKTYSAQTVVRERIMSEETARMLLEFMRNNVVSRYGTDNFPGLTVCAKSGTAQVNSAHKPNAMFAGFVADDAYPLAFIVCVEDAGYGTTVCVPILSKVLAVCKEVLDAS